MDIPNTDLLPPLFDQVLTHYGENIIAPYGRREIINILANEIVNVAVDRQRSAEMVPGYDGSQDAAVELTTFDRLSGEHLSRAGSERPAPGRRLYAAPRYGRPALSHRYCWFGWRNLLAPADASGRRVARGK